MSEAHCVKASDEERNILLSGQKIDLLSFTSFSYSFGPPTIVFHRFEKLLETYLPTKATK